MNSSVLLRGYKQPDDSYKIFVIKRDCDNKTEWHNWVRYYKQNYTNFVGASYHQWGHDL